MNEKKDNDFYYTAIAWCLALSAVLMFTSAVILEEREIKDVKAWAKGN